MQPAILVPSLFGNIGDKGACARPYSVITGAHEGGTMPNVPERVTTVMVTR